VATALAATPAQCSGAQFATGIAAMSGIIGVAAYLKQSPLPADDYSPDAHDAHTPGQ